MTRPIRAGAPAWIRGFPGAGVEPEVRQIAAYLRLPTRESDANVPTSVSGWMLLARLPAVCLDVACCAFTEVVVSQSGLGASA
jgi:hypothetical protein